MCLIPNSSSRPLGVTGENEADICFRPTRSSAGGFILGQPVWRSADKIPQANQRCGSRVQTFSDAHELEKLIYQSLVETGGSKIDISKPDRIHWRKDKSPYPGLFLFDQEYAELFFGRDQEVAELIAKLCGPDGRFLLISGASGSGKSSLVGAGLWRALICEDRIPGSKTWEWLRIQPGDGKESPFEALAWGLRQTSLRFTQRPEKLADELAAEPSSLAGLVASKLADDQELILFVDQWKNFSRQALKAMT